MSEFAKNCQIACEKIRELEAAGGDMDSNFIKFATLQIENMGQFFEAELTKIKVCIFRIPVFSIFLNFSLF